MEQPAQSVCAIKQNLEQLTSDADTSENSTTIDRSKIAIFGSKHDTGT